VPATAGPATALVLAVSAFASGQSLEARFGLPACVPNQFVNAPAEAIAAAHATAAVAIDHLPDRRIHHHEAPHLHRAMQDAPVEIRAAIGELQQDVVDLSVLQLA
jgi:hypothetical protein